MEICRQKMSYDEFMEVWEQAHQMSDELKKQGEIK